jgi:Fe2+ or Zn2+ uptake regulation protein
MPSARGSHDPLDDLQQRCRELGIPLTVQRRAVYAVLASRSDHPTADQVFEGLHERVPGISKATAYRTLDTLVELGLVVRVSHPGRGARYDAKTARHHHLVCDGCGAVADLESRQLDALPLPDLKPTGFRTRDFSVHVRGFCQDCVENRVDGGSRPAVRTKAARTGTASSGARRRQKSRRNP